MISRSSSSTSIKNQSVYLTGLIVACFLHFSCQFLPASLSMADGNKSDTSSRLDNNESSSKTSITIKDIFITGHVGKKGEISQENAIYRYADDVIAHKTVNTNDNNGPIHIFCAADGRGIKNSPISGDFAKEIVEGVFLSNANTPQGMIIDGYEPTTKSAPKKCQKTGKTGATTICVVTIDSSGRLKSASLGDTRAMVFRNDKVAFQTEKQKGNGFNDPHVLVDGAHYGRDNKDPLANLMVDQYKRPEDCICEEGEVKKGDVLIIATDGLWDNVYPEELIEIIKSHKSTEEIANKAKEKALANSKNTSKCSPYEDDLKQALKDKDDNALDYQNHKGGKPNDDASIAVAKID